MIEKKLILASASPRRSELLNQIGIGFTVDVSDTDEASDQTDPGLLVSELSFRKASAVFARHQDDVVLAADTVVYSDGHILGKPASRQMAGEMIRVLSGKVHQVYTGVTVIDRDGAFTDYCITDVRFRTISESELEAYLNTGDYAGKAGAYAIQGRAAVFCNGITGDFSNVVGLPIPMVYDFLKRKGISVWQEISE